MGMFTGTIISIALMVAYRLLTLPKKPKNLGQDQPTTLSTRGSWLNTIIGTHRTGYVFALVGQRVIRSNGGGGKGSGGGSTGEAYRENAWHLVCPGPATGLVAIYMNNKPIWTEELSIETTPSGSQFALPNGGGTFAIYWGDDGQPIPPFVARKTGVRSRWEGYFSIEWYGFDLGTSPTWPQVEYVVRVQCPSIALTQSNYLLTGDGTTGINVAHGILQIMCAPYPQGMGILPENLDETTLEAFGELAQLENMAINVNIEGGNAASNAIASLIQDAGVFIPEYEGRLTFIPNRAVAEEDVVVIPDDAISPPMVEPTIYHGESNQARAVFSYKDETKYAYREIDIKFDNDGEFSEIGTVSTQTTNIESFTNSIIANRVAARRSQEAEAYSVIKVTGLRATKLLYIGQVFTNSYTGQCRLVSMRPSTESASVEIECAPDVYGVGTVDDTQGLPGGGSEQNLSALPDLGFKWFERALYTPPFADPQTGVVVLRTRAHSQIAGAFIWGSTDGTTYTRLGSQVTPAAGGLIESGISSGASDPITAGPLFEADNDDVNNVLDLSADTAGWNAGKQIAVINDEIFHLQAITQQTEADWVTATAYTPGDVIVPLSPTGLRYVCTTGGTSGASEPAWTLTVGNTTNDNGVIWEAHRFLYELTGLQRAKYGTVAGTHTAGDRVYIIDPTALEVLNHPILEAGATLCIKTEPYTSTERVTLASVTPECHTYVG